MVVGAAADLAPVVHRRLLLLPRVRDVAVQPRPQSLALTGCAVVSEMTRRVREVGGGRRVVEQRRGDHDGEERENDGGYDKGRIHGWLQLRCPVPGAGIQPVE